MALFVVLKIFRLAKDLIESFIQIVQIRLPLISPAMFVAQFESQNPREQPPHVLLAVVLAHGSKYSEHRIILKGVFVALPVS